jgi:predicted MFS family arabinose efflux permease
LQGRVSIPWEDRSGDGLSTQGETERTHLSRWLVLLLAVVVGASVANLYYAQPLLHTIGDDLHVGDSTAGLLVTASQLGYAVGLALLVPLGDLLERRRLVVLLMVLTGLAALLVAVVPSFPLVLAAIAVVGLAASVAQIVVPLAASLAADDERGRVVGTVMSGLLIGILAARTVGGFLAEAGGWRVVFAAAAGVMFVLAAVLWWVLPPVRPTAGDLHYAGLLRSVGSLVLEEPVLRQRMVLGAVGMTCFTTLWTALAFLLSGPHYGYGPATIGLFGLAGLAGAGMAPISGRLADRGHGRFVAPAGFVLLVLSWVLLALGGTSLAALLAGIVALDLAQQSLQINHQSTIYALRPEARSRLTTAFVVSIFLGGAAASAVASALYAAEGWTGVSVFGGAIAAFGLIFYVVSETRLRRAGAGSVQLVPEAAQTRVASVPAP